MSDDVAQSLTPSPQPLAPTVDFGLAGRVVLVVGATGGIGRAVSAALAAGGARLAASSTSLDKARALVDEVGGEAAAFACDVTVPESVDALCEFLRAYKK